MRLAQPRKHDFSTFARQKKQKRDLRKTRRYESNTHFQRTSCNLGRFPARLTRLSERKRQLLKNEVVPWRSILIAAA